MHAAIELLKHHHELTKADGLLQPPSDGIKETDWLGWRPAALAMAFLAAL